MEETTAKKSPFWQKLVLLLVTTGVVTGFITNWFGYHKDVDMQAAEFSKDEISALLLEIKEDRDYYKELYRDCNANMQRLSAEITAMKVDLQLVGAMSNEVPFPAWTKAKDFKMMWLNPSYENVFLKPKGITPIQYIGSYDADIWGKELAKSFRKHDMEALKSKEPIVTVEVFPDEYGDIWEWRVVKFQRLIGQQVVGIGGFCFKVVKV